MEIVRASLLQPRYHEWQQKADFRWGSTQREKGKLEKLIVQVERVDTEIFYLFTCEPRPVRQPPRKSGPIQPHPLRLVQTPYCLHPNQLPFNDNIAATLFPTQDVYIQVGIYSVTKYYCNLLEWEKCGSMGESWCLLTHTEKVRGWYPFRWEGFYRWEVDTVAASRSIWNIDPRTPMTCSLISSNPWNVASDIMIIDRYSECHSGEWRCLPLLYGVLLNESWDSIFIAHIV